MSAEKHTDRPLLERPLPAAAHFLTRLIRPAGHPGWPGDGKPRVEVGDVVAPRELVTVDDQAVAVPDAAGGRLVHLQFRRFAGCPVCDLHLRSLARRHADLAAAGVLEVAVFHSAAGELRPYVAGLPFPVVPDPGKRLYAEFCVESGPRALLDPRAWGPVIRAVAHAMWGIVRAGRPLPPVNPRGGRLGLPADFLIVPDGRVLARRYGAHVHDQWSVDEILDLAARGGGDVDGSALERLAPSERGAHHRPGNGADGASGPSVAQPPSA